MIKEGKDKKEKMKRGGKKKKKEKIKIKKETTKTIYFYAGFTVSIISLFLLVAFAAIGLGMKDKIALEIYNKNNNEDIKTINSMIIFLSSAWLLLALMLILSIVSVSNNINRWYYFLIIGILSFFAFRIETSILILISSFLMLIEKINRKNSKKIEKRK